MEVDVTVKEEFLEQEFFVETTIIKSVVHKVQANSFEQAKRLVNMKCVSELNVVDTNIYKEIEDVTEKYQELFNQIDNIVKGMDFDGYNYNV